MSIISRLGKRFREKPKSTNLNLPSLPTPREVLEDLECCPNNDSVITLYTIIQKKGRQGQSLLDSDYIEDPNNLQQSQLAFLSPYQTEPGDKPKEDTQTKPAAVTKGKGGSSGQPSSSKSKKSDMEHINSYNKLKQFLLLHEKSEELLEDLEPQLKTIEAVLRTREEFSSPSSSDNVNHLMDIKEKDLDVCSSPLM